MDFEWDPEKAERNLAKHSVTFHEAANVFGDPLALTFSDPDHSDEEDRFLTFGHSSEGHLLVVSRTDREAETGTQLESITSCVPVSSPLVASPFPVPGVRYGVPGTLLAWVS